MRQSVLNNPESGSSIESINFSTTIRLALLGSAAELPRAWGLVYRIIAGKKLILSQLIANLFALFARLKTEIGV